MAEVSSPVRPSPSASPATVIAVSKFEGLGLEPNNNNNEVAEIGSDQAEAVTKEEEIITKRKTDIITTKQIETRVKRNVTLEDGKVVEDSGPIVSTSTTEDVEKQESEQTERRNLGEPDVIEGPKALEGAARGGEVVEAGVTAVKELVPRPKDGLVREVHENLTLSREEKNERVEIEDVHHLGDFSDEAYVKAINSGVEDISEVLLSSEAKKQLVARGPRVTHESYNVNKVIDSEDTDTRYKAQEDGTLVTEQTKTTQHEELYDDELPPAVEGEVNSEKFNHTESHQRYHKQRDEQLKQTAIDGTVVKSEMRYVAETENMERDGPKEEIEDWDSLSDRIRKQRRMQKSMVLRQREAAALADRMDALTKRPLDVDLEEETRKHETSKWLESHFGSESSAKSSSDQSRDDDILPPSSIEPTKKTFFNVTIKSGPTTPSSTPSPQPVEPVSKLSAPSKVVLPDREPKKYFQGISEWSERAVIPPPKPLVTKEFQEKLAGTLQRKMQRQSVEDLRVKGTKAPEDNYAVVNKKKTDLRTQKEDLGYLSGSRTDLRELERKKNVTLTRQDSGYIRESREDLRPLRTRESSFIKDEEPKISRDDSAYVSSSTYFTTPRSPRRPRSPINRTPDSGIKSPSPPSPEKTSPAVFPSVPERKRAFEKKFTSVEPPPDYSPPPTRSRSHSPAIQTVQRKQKTRFSESVPRSTTKGPAPQPPAIPKPVMPAAQTQTEPDLMQPKAEKKKVGSAIGNSLRKLVGKIRSVSAERKLKLAHKSSKTRSPSPQQKNGNLQHRSATTYQQYNNVDSHIGARNGVADVMKRDRTPQRDRKGDRRDRTVVERRGSDADANSTNTGSGGSASNMITSPKQRFYLGENPYQGSIFGKENKYEGARPQRNYSRRKSEEPQVYHSRNTLLATQNNANSSTLGRFSKSTNRLTATNSLNHDSTGSDYRTSSQTLPRKLEHKPLHSSTINVSIVNTVPKPLANTGPAKPARSYKSVSRSKSFNVHGLNGTNDPSPIYIEKVGSRFSNHASMYKSNPHLNEVSPQLKSPSIVNLISRSTRDLSNIHRTNGNDDYYERYNNYSNGTSDAVDSKKSVFLKNLHDRSPELYKAMHEEPLRNGNIYRYRERESSLGSRSPVTINKDTATILRRGSSSTEDYSETFKSTTKSADPHHPGITNTVETISRKTVPAPDGRGQTRIESREVKSVTSSHHRYGTPLKYVEARPPRGNGVVIEVRNRH